MYHPNDTQTTGDRRDIRTGEIIIAHTDIHKHTKYHRPKQKPPEICSEATYHIQKIVLYLFNIHYAHLLIIVNIFSVLSEEFYAILFYMIFILLDFYVFAYCNLFLKGSLLSCAYQPLLLHIHQCLHIADDSFLV